MSAAKGADLLREAGVSVTESRWTPDEEIVLHLAAQGNVKETCQKYWLLASSMNKEGGKIRLHDKARIRKKIAHVGLLSSK